MQFSVRLPNRVILDGRALAWGLTREEHGLWEYTRLVSSTFWEKLDNSSGGPENWADTEEMIRYLTNPRLSAPLAFVIARILQRKYPQQLADVQPAEQLEGCVTERDLPCYLALIHDLFERTGTTGMFRNSQLTGYLDGSIKNLRRDNCFRLAFALALGEDDTLELLQACGQPGFNYRIPQELVYFFCFCNQDLYDDAGEQNPFGWEFAQRLLDEVNQATVDAPAQGTQVVPGQTALLEDDILQMLDAPATPEQRTQTLRDYLIRQAPVMTGYSQTAYACFDDLLDQITELCAENSGEKVPEKESVRLAWVSGQMYRNIWPQYGEGSTGDFVPLQKATPGLPDNLTVDPLWRARLRKLRTRKIPVTKHDILFLNMILWEWWDTGLDGKEAVESFMFEVNDMLYRIGMSGIYLPNSYDRLILLAVASGCPTAFLGDFYEAGADESIVTELIEKNRSRER